MNSEERKVNDMLMMIKYLSEFIVKHGIEITESRTEFIQNLIFYVHVNTLKGLKDVVNVFHKVLKHQDSFMRLTCKQLHCIECYNYFVNDDFYNEYTVCSCGIRINPRDRGLIFDNYDRLEKLKRVCSLCGIKQDKMNFSELENHNCYLCLNCLYQTFIFFSEDNVCAYCRQLYTEENSNTIRAALAHYYEENEVKEFYSRNCFICRQKKDSREFVQICQNEHLCCRECKQQLLESRQQKCSCQSELSLIS